MTVGRGLGAVIGLQPLTRPVTFVCQISPKLSFGLCVTVYMPSFIPRVLRDNDKKLLQIQWTLADGLGLHDSAL
jgi:hypothetical protein